MGNDFLAHLNSEQRGAVEATEGPVMIIAGAGSGKTRVLTYRIAHLLNKGVDPYRVLSLTFTNKAAREMKERIAHLIGDHARDLWMGTFHSVFARLLRREATKIGYPANFTIYDTDDSKTLLKSIVKEMSLNDTAYKASSLLGRISSMKTMLISPKEYLNDIQYINEDRASRREHFAQIYETYNKRLYKSGAMDFDDLLYHTNMLLRDHPESLLKYQDMFRYILVDEYQDTNFSQYMILRQLAARHLNICVVGDDAQSIYAFRGANIQNILNFQKHYPDTQIFKLEQNYRSTKTIVAAANQVISKNRDQLQKTVWTSNEEGEKIRVSRAFSDSEEGRLIAQSIFDTRVSKQAKNKEFAILYRTNAQSRPLEEALRKLNIPYRIYGGVSFYQRKEIKDIMAYFRLTINQHDEEALRRVINYPVRGIGDTTFDKMIVAAADNDVSIWTVMENIADFNLPLQTRAIEKIKEFVTLIKSFTALLPDYPAYKMGDYIASTSGIMKELYQDRTPEGVNRMENIQELLNGLKDFTEKADQEGPVPTLDKFMEDIALLTSEDINEDEEHDADKVLLMTIHAAKGLEFNYVYIGGLEENLFPSQMAIMSREELEEERRLFYVAITRAKKQANLSYSISRYKYGNSLSCEPSRFLEEIPQECVENTISYSSNSSSSNDSYTGFPRTPKVFNVSPPVMKPAPTFGNKKLVSIKKVSSGAPVDNSHLTDLQAGAKVEHDRFGIGEVITIEGRYPNSKAIVMFENGEKKQLLLRFARLKILS
ncbi:MAG TPA: UvrD-helicase domain-containing protein [Bacteroidia bacterium]|jgi:DNA helicase-2/ATP-dependent DNA helicase PcrA|nr:UvrD-helicase domain-containing protein [Bacteroidia bacterium]